MADDIRILIDDDAVEGASKPGRESIEELRRITNEKQAEAARFRQEAAHLNAVASRQRVSAALHVADSEAQSAASEYRNALETGDSDDVVRAQSRMAEIEARRVRLREHDHALRATPLPPADPIEAACYGRSPTTAAWIRNHPEHVRDPRKFAKLTAAHYDAEADGLAPDTPEYFNHIERRVGIRAGKSGGITVRSGVPAGINPADPRTHVNGNEVFLTKGEREAATKTLLWNYGPKKGQPLGIEEYARRKAAMIAQGRYQTME